MKRYISLLMGILGFIPILAQQSEYYYYYDGNRIDLDVDSTHLYVVSESEFQPKSSSYTRSAEYTIISTSRSYTYNHVVPLQQRRNAVPEVYFSTLELSEGLTASQYQTLIEKIKEDSKVWQVLPSFNLNGKCVNVTNNIYVGLKSSNDVNMLQEMAKKYSIEILGNNVHDPLWYTLSCTFISAINAIEAANLFYKTGLFEYCEPEFCYHDLARSTRSNDELYETQWALNRENIGIRIASVDINVEEAWEETEGEGVVVAVFDSGVSTTHPDLQNNITEYSYDATSNTEPAIIVKNEEDNTYNSHGTACAGIIAAERNNDGIGICGVAPKAKIMPISIDLSRLTPQQIVSGLYNACDNGADIISCSWGGVHPSSCIDNAIKYVMRHGRDRKGTLLVFASGNTDEDLLYPENSDSRILTVGAVAHCGARVDHGTCENDFIPWGSCFGEKLDVVAPGAFISTTSVSGSTILRNGYTDEFDGTSAACAYVSGVAALVLSIHPQLYVEDLAQVIERTAQKVRTDLYSYSTDTIHRNGTWYEEIGYGLVDAGTAVTTPLEDLVESYYRNKIVQDYDCCINYNVEVENVEILSSDGYIELGAVNRILVKSRLKVEKGARLEMFNVIYNEILDRFEYVSP